MKKFCVFRKFICCFLALLMVSVPVVKASAEADLSVEQGAHSIDAKLSVIQPLEELALAPGVILYDVTDDTVVYTTDPDGTYDPAGLVKLMTGLIVAEKGNMNDMITITQELLDECAGYHGIDFLPGEVVSLYDLLNCIMLEGANIAAIAAAKHVSGDLETFVSEMNAYAAEIGCTGTNFTNIYGLYDEAQVTTARDVVKILMALSKNSVAYESFSTYAVRTSPTNLAEDKRLYNPSYIFNRNLGSNHYDDRVTGCKVAETIEGDWNIAASATNGTVEVMGVILGSTSEISPDGKNGVYKELRILLDKVLDGHYSTKILYANQVLEQFEVKNGANYVTAYANADVLTSLPNNITNTDLVYLYKNEEIVAPVAAGDKVSYVQIWYNNICLAQTDLYALHDVDVKEVIQTEQIDDKQGADGFTVLKIMIVIVGLLLLLLFGRPLIFRVVNKQKARRQKRERRRKR